MRNEMYDKNTEKRQHLDARNETNAINLFGLAFLCGNADEKSTGAHRKRSVNVRSVFVEPAEQARYSSTSGGLPRPEPGRGQPTPPYKTAAQFSRSLSRSSFSCARLRLVRATAHADAYDLSTPAVD